jgi:hypothetical protein
MVVSILRGLLIACQLCFAVTPTLFKDSILSFLLVIVSNVRMILLIQILSKSLLRWAPQPRLQVNRCHHVSRKTVPHPLIVLRTLGDPENLRTQRADQCTIVTAIKDSMVAAQTVKSPNSKLRPPDAEPIPKDRLSLIMPLTMSTKLRFPPAPN